MVRGLLKCFVYYYLLNILHPLRHLLMAHVIHILDESEVLLPERHPEAGLKHSGSVVVVSRLFIIVFLGHQQNPTMEPKDCHREEGG